MKKLSQFNLLLAVITVFLGVSAIASPIADKNKGKKKPKKEKPLLRMLLVDTTNCANYYDAMCIIQQASHNNSCPSGCTMMHTQPIAKEKTLKTCPKGKLYNPQKLACDFPENVNCPHTPKCTNN